jgi:O-antigen/teichoic acid export membrane protein
MVIGQGLTALTTLLLSVMVARNATASAFGAFAVAFLVYSLVLEFSRAVVGQPLQISFASATQEEFRNSAGHALGAAVVFGLIAALSTAVAGLVVGGQSGAALIALGLWFPTLILQDTYRMAFFTEGTPKRAAAIDSVRAVVVLGGCLGALAAGVADRVVIPLTLWGFGAAVATLYGIVLLRVGPTMRGSVRWMRNRQHLSCYLGVEYLLKMGIGQAGILMVGFVETAGVGALRGAQVLLGPMNVVGTAAMVFTTTEVARRPTASARHRSLLAGAVSGILWVAITAYVGFLLVLPDSWGEHLLGDTWTGAKSVMLPICLAAAAASLTAGPVATLYGMGLARATFSINVLRAALNIVLLAVGILKWGAVGAAWALAITEIVLLPLWIVRLRIALQTGERGCPGSRRT